MKGICWEFYEWGGWKATNAFINDFLEEQFLSGVNQAFMKIDDEDNARYEWNFSELLQRRRHLIDGEWRTVKTRSVRRIRVLAAPAEPCEFFGRKKRRCTPPPE